MPTNIPQTLQIQLPSPLQPCAALSTENSQVWIKRDDQIHPIISGNKWRKLQAFFTTDRNDHTSLPSSIVSFGGGHSNHLHALGYICGQLHIPFYAIIRGNYAANMTPCLHDLTQWGTNLVWHSKLQYQRRHDPQYLAQLQLDYPNALIIPEGGSDEQALSGVGQSIAEIAQQLSAQHLSHQPTRNLIILPVATGTTLAGIIQALPTYLPLRNPKHKYDVMGVAVLKSHSSAPSDYLESMTRKLLATNHSAVSDSHTPVKWWINHAYHMGGYAKTNSDLNAFCAAFSAPASGSINTPSIPIEPIYSGKAFFALHDMLNKCALDDYDNIIIFHTGGLQGAR